MLGDGLPEPVFYNGFRGGFHIFGPTDPGVWAPPHEHVRILRAPAGKLEELSVSTVMSALRPLLGTLRLASGAEPSETLAL